MKFYHYTIADRLVKILIDGYLMLTPSKETTEDGELRLVWLTSSPTWDNTAFFGYPPEVLDNAGRIRITINKIYSTPKKFYDMIPMFDSLCDSARRVGVDPEDWGVSVDEIYIHEFEKIELWRDNEWTEIHALNHLMNSQ